MFQKPLVNSPKEALKIIVDSLGIHQNDDKGAEQMNKMLNSHPTLNLRELLSETIPEVCSNYTSVLQPKDYKMAKRYSTMAEVMSDTVVYPFPCRRLANLNSAIRTLPVENTGRLASLYHQRSEMLLNKQDFADALINIELAIRLRPSHPEYFLTRVRILQKLGQLDSALEVLSNRRNVVLPADQTPEFEAQVKKLKYQIRREQKFPLEESQRTGQKLAPRPQLDFTLRLHQSVTVDVRSEKNATYCLKVKELVAEGTVLFEECPAVLVSNAPEVAGTCIDCSRACANTFVPCSTCSDALFCSTSCRDKSCDQDGLHAQECQFVQFFADSLGTSGYQLYRILATLGLDNYLAILTSRISDASKLPKLVANAAGSGDPNRFDLVRWFAMSQHAPRDRFLKLFPSRKSEDFAKAAMVLGIYMFKNPGAGKAFTDEELQTLWLFCAVDIARMRAMEFCHTLKDKKKDDKKVYNAMQTLAASTLAPSCSQNSTWAWNGQFFSLTASKAIPAGTELTISYGSSTLGFYERQKSMNSFGTFCACRKCLKDAGNHFALKCESCSGMVPFQDSLYENQVCIECFSLNPELDLALARSTYQGFVNAQKIANLYQIVGGAQDAEKVLHLENFFVRLFQNTYRHSRPLLRAIQTLALAHIKHGYKYMGASWFQWLKEHYGIYLTDIESQVSTMQSFQAYAEFTEALFQSSMVRNEVSMYNSGVELLVQLKYSLEHKELTKGQLTTDHLIESVGDNAQQQIKVLNEQFRAAQQYFIDAGLIEDSSQEARLQSSLEQSEASRRPETIPEEEEELPREDFGYDDEIKFEVCAGSQDVPAIAEQEVPQFLNDIPSVISRDSDEESLSSDIVSVTTLSDSIDLKPETVQQPDTQSETQPEVPEIAEQEAGSEGEVLHYQESSDCSQSLDSDKESLSGSLIVGETSSDSEDSLF